MHLIPVILISLIPHLCANNRRAIISVVVTISIHMGKKKKNTHTHTHTHILHF